VPHWRAWGGLAVLGLLLLLGWPLRLQLEQRMDWAVSEVAGYRNSGDADTSIGQRLDHWQLAWAMGCDRPLLGWGNAGYAAEKARRVAAGQASAAVLEFSHAHNEVLDQFAKRGLIGVAGLSALYLVPLALFWPRRRVLGAAGPARDDEICLRLMGVTFVVAHIGFGLTQVFFAHYNGVMIYIGMVILIFAGLQAKKITPAPAAAAA
jgi:O-antigen ligase